MSVRERANIAYEAYREHTGGKSLATGADIPEWDMLPADIQAAWHASIWAVDASAQNQKDAEAEANTPILRGALQDLTPYRIEYGPYIDSQRTTVKLQSEIVYGADVVNARVKEFTERGFYVETKKVDGVECSAVRFVNDDNLRVILTRLETEIAELRGAVEDVRTMADKIIRG